jgi:hypothetical protein
MSPTPYEMIKKANRIRGAHWSEDEIRRTRARELSKRAEVIRWRAQRVLVDRYPAEFEPLFVQAKERFANESNPSARAASHAGRCLAKHHPGEFAELKDLERRAYDSRNALTVGEIVP